MASEKDVLFRVCINCDHLPENSIERTPAGEMGVNGYRHSKGASWDNSPYCNSCQDIDFGEEGCLFKVAPIPFLEVEDEG